MKFLIIIFYYERPFLLKKLVESIACQDYENWEVCIIDDGTIFKAREYINFDVFGNNKVTLLEIGDSEDEKKRREKIHGSFGGSNFGAFANTAISLTDATHVVTVCDDDLLKKDYLSNLCKWYSENDVEYSYCHLEFQQPMTKKHIENDYTRYLNSVTHPVNPVNQLDSSQITWKVSSWLNAGIKYPHPQTSHLDRTIFEQMHAHWGPCRFNGIVGQIKGIHPDQLINK